MLSGCLLAVAPSTARLTLNSEFQGTLRRLKPEKHKTPLKPRPESELEFIESAGSWTTKLLYDTTVYIDILQNCFPRKGDIMLRAAEAWHSPVTEAELAATCGLLDPAHTHHAGSWKGFSVGTGQAIAHSQLIPKYGVKREFCPVHSPGCRDTRATSDAGC